MLVCNENLFIYAYGYCIYLAHELPRSCCTSHKAIVEFRTSLLWSLYTLVVLLLFIHHHASSLMLCWDHRFAQLLYFLRRSYYERSPGILCFYSVFFTIPCIFWYHPHCRELCCILHNNISILSSLTTSLMCWLLQHYLYPFSRTYHSAKTQRAHKLVLKIGKNRLYSTLFLSHL